MATKVNINDKQVLKHITSGLSIPKAANAMGIHPSTMADAFYRLEPVADPSLVISGTKAQVAKKIVALRNAGIRWERLAARSGLSVKQVKAVFTETAKVEADSTYTGRGRHYERKATSVRGTRAARPNTRKNTGNRRKATAK